MSLAAGLFLIDNDARLQAAIDRSGITKDGVQEVFMGNVIQAAGGQAPARQAALFAGNSLKIIVQVD